MIKLMMLRMRNQLVREMTKKEIKMKLQMLRTTPVSKIKAKVMTLLWMIKRTVMQKTKKLKVKKLKRK